MKKLIYAADDELNIRELLKTFLVDAGFDVRTFATGDELFSCFKDTPCDLVILDIMMPGTDGLTVCRNIREISKVPIIILTAKDSELDYATGMTYGGDDYLIKPFKPTMLVMRIKALFRRIEMEHNSENDAEKDTVKFGDLVCSLKKHEISCKGQNTFLTLTEYALLKYMMENDGIAVSRETLLDEIWGIDADIETRVTDETIRRIRKKLSAVKSNVVISVIWGFGYKLEISE